MRVTSEDTGSTHTTFTVPASRAVVRERLVRLLERLDDVARYHATDGGVKLRTYPTTMSPGYLVTISLRDGPDGALELHATTESLRESPGPFAGNKPASLHVRLTTHVIRTLETESTSETFDRSKAVSDRDDVTSPTRAERRLKRFGLGFFLLCVLASTAAFFWKMTLDYTAVTDVHDLAVIVPITVGVASAFLYRIVTPWYFRTTTAGKHPSITDRP